MTNKHAQIRYSILDRCFSNRNRQFTYDDLLEEVNDQLFQLGTEGIKLRQLQYDMQFMESEAGFSVEFDPDAPKKGLRGTKKTWRYLDQKFTISDNPLNVNDTEQLETTLAILSRYRYRKEFDWLDALIPRIEQAFNIRLEDEASVISYQSNRYLQGKEWVGKLFNVILKKKVISLAYQPYGADPMSLEVHPYHLKQYNNRWFLFALNPSAKMIHTYALDRILDLNETAQTVDPCDVDWVDYFFDIVGVTRPENDEIMEIRMRFSPKRINYVLSKPLHPSQRPDKSDDEGRTVIIEVMENKELYQLLFSFGGDMEVLSPLSIRTKMASKAAELNNLYNNA